jgi:hypothetical protein
MAKRQAAVETEIARRLEAALSPGSPNRITAQEMRAWAVEYLDETVEELSRFTDLAGQPHWNLWMMDTRFEDALFAVLIFRADDVEFFCGTGNAFQIKRFAESDYPNNPDDVLAMMTAKFSIPEGSIRLARQAAEKWLGRGW